MGKQWGYIPMIRLMLNFWRFRLVVLIPQKYMALECTDITISLGPMGIMSFIFGLVVSKITERLYYYELFKTI